MEFSPVSIAFVILGMFCVVIGIRGSNKAVFQSLTGHTAGASPEASGPLVSGNPMVIPGSGEVGATK